MLPKKEYRPPRIISRGRKVEVVSKFISETKAEL